jgi:predicted flap endonuclease-1-like 5' DNA nuclease
MDINSIIFIFLIVLIVILALAYYFLLRRGKKKQTPETPKIKPQNTSIEPTEPINPAPEVEPPSTVVEVPKESVDLAPIVAPQSTVVETPKETEPVDTTPMVATQSTIVESQMQAESSQIDDVKTEQAGSRKDGRKPTPKTRDHGSKLHDIEGIGPVNAEKLGSIGIYTTSDLLESGATPHERIELAEKTGISPKLILEWVNLSDLFRIKGIGEEYSDLLEEAGVDTVVELAHRNAVNLHAKILEVNEAKKLVRRPPSQAMIEGWIRDAKNLPRKIEY